MAIEQPASPRSPAGGPASLVRKTASSPGELLLPLVDAGPAERKMKGAGSVLSKFVMAPFSVLNGQTGAWRERKAQWVNLGIQSEVGRDTISIHMGKQSYEGKFSDSESAADVVPSIFDPVLCELVYTWFAPPNGLVYDPFAGGSVRGIVAGMCGRDYLGVDLSERQVMANGEQWERIGGVDSGRVEWMVGDSRDTLVHLRDRDRPDLVFTCPPYFDLEVYSDDPRDLSTAPTYEDFLVSLRLIVAECAHVLKPNRFACIVVGDIRGKDGKLRNFPGDTIEAFEAAGLRLYNEAMIVTPVGSLAMRVPAQMAKTRKLGKSHQNVLVFVKGDVDRVRDEFGEIPSGLLG